MTPTDHAREEARTCGHGAGRRRAAAALIAAGPLALAFHVVYGVTHGPTVFNENHELLGLTNLQWDRVAGLWMLLAAVGVIGIHRAQRGRTSAVGASLVVAGLVLHAGAAWLFHLYVPSFLALTLGLVVLGVAVVTAGRLPRWAGAAAVAAVVAWVPFAVANDATYDFRVSLAGLTAHGDDLVAAAFAVAWVALGVALLHVREDETRSLGKALTPARSVERARSPRE